MLTDEQRESVQYAAEWLGRSDDIGNQKHAERLRALLAVHSAKSHDAWKLAIDDELVTIGSTADSFDSPKAAIAALIEWHVSAALDPAISKSAQDLIDKGRVSDGAQEPVAWRVSGTYTNGLHFSHLYDDKATAEKSAASAAMRVLTPLYAQPQPMTQTDAARDVLAKAVTRYDELTGSIQGCADGGCLIRKPEGLHTNSGCRCARDHVKMQRAMYAAGELRKALAEIERLDGAPTAEGE